MVNRAFVVAMHEEVSYQHQPTSSKVSPGNSDEMYHKEDHDQAARPALGHGADVRLCLQALRRDDSVE